jgi:hypothetical protein
VIPPAPDRACQLAAALELRFAQDAELARKLNDAHERLQHANARLWCELHPHGMTAVYGEHPAAVDAAVAENRSEVLGAPDPLQAKPARTVADPPSPLRPPARRRAAPPRRSRHRRRSAATSSTTWSRGMV